MPTERYFVNDNFNVHDNIALTNVEFHHLAHVMRTRQGDQVELVNGRGQLAHANVLKITKETAFLKITAVLQSLDQENRIILAQAFTRSNKLDMILEKGTELGVTEFWLFPGEYSVKNEYSQHQIERAHTLMISAMKQCGRLTLPSLIIQPFIQQWQNFTTTAFFGDISPDAPLLSQVWNHIQTKYAPIIFVTGPESGFSTKETIFLEKLGAHGVKIHNHILRTETASIMAISLLSHWLLAKLAH